MYVALICSEFLKKHKQTWSGPLDTTHFHLLALWLLSGSVAVFMGDGLSKIFQSELWRVGGAQRLLKADAGCVHWSSQRARPVSFCSSRLQRVSCGVSTDESNEYRGGYYSSPILCFSHIRECRCKTVLYQSMMAHFLMGKKRLHCSMGLYTVVHNATPCEISGMFIPSVTIYDVRFSMYS